MADDFIPDPDPQDIIEVDEFTDKIELRLLQNDEPQPGVLRDLVRVIREAQRHADPSQPPSQPFRNRVPGEALVAEAGALRAFARIEQIAAGCEAQAEVLKEKVRSEGPGATDADLTDFVREIYDAVKWLNEHGMRVNAKSRKK